MCKEHLPKLRDVINEVEANDHASFILIHWKKNKEGGIDITSANGSLNDEDLVMAAHLMLSENIKRIAEKEGLR